jgi:hypothetical protein
MLFMRTTKPIPPDLTDDRFWGCPNCGVRFDLHDDDAVYEWESGHLDCSWDAAETDRIAMVQRMSGTA